MGLPEAVEGERGDEGGPVVSARELVEAVRAVGLEAQSGAAAHEAAIAAPLSPAQRRQLSDLLAQLAAGHGLRPGIHPGYRHLPGPDGPGRD